MALDGSVARDVDLREHLRTLGSALLVVFLAFLCALVVASIGARALVAVGFAREGLPIRVALTVLQFVGFGVGVGGYLAVTDDWGLLRARFPTLRDLGWILVGVVAILGGAIAVSQVLSALGVTVAQNQVIVTGQENPEFFLYMIPVSLLLVGPFEELVFRGAVQGLFRRRYGPPAAIAAASALFGVAHWVALTGAGSRVSYVAVAAVLGVVLGVVYERSENLVVPAVVHGGYNAVLFTVQYVAATGVAG